MSFFSIFIFSNFSLSLASVASRTISRVRFSFASIVAASMADSYAVMSTFGLNFLRILLAGGPSLPLESDKLTIVSFTSSTVFLLIVEQLAGSELISLRFSADEVLGSISGSNGNDGPSHEARPMTTMKLHQLSLS